jgi:hypothetical protein
MAFGPDSGDARDRKAAEVGPALSLFEQNRRVVTPVRKRRQKRQVVMIPENGEDGDAQEKRVPNSRWNFARISPVTDTKQTVRIFRIEQAKQRFCFAMEISDRDYFAQMRTPAA